MKKESIKKKLSFKKTFVANLNQEAAQSIKGGDANSVIRSSDCGTYSCGGSGSGGVLICDIVA
ncbi:MAG: class I lanthipeptide [Lewinellaceae bacterium]|nr:class I lanthipeptide [Lewinellaceae bacterium]